jgi:chemotaxis protein MotB
MIAQFAERYEAEPRRSIAWALMLADTGLLLTAFFALMVAHAEPPTTPINPMRSNIVSEVPRSAEELLARLRQNRAEIEMSVGGVQLAHLHAVDPMENLYRKLVSQLDPAQLILERAGNTIVVSLGSAVHFAPGSAELDAAALRSIASLGGLLAEFRSEISVEGHADNRALSGRYQDNWELASARAASVVRELRPAIGPSGSVLRSVSYGDQKPLSDTQDTAWRERNHRVEIRIRPL